MEMRKLKPHELEGYVDVAGIDVPLAHIVSNDVTRDLFRFLRCKDDAYYYLLHMEGNNELPPQLKQWSGEHIDEVLQTANEVKIVINAMKRVFKQRGIEHDWPF